MVLLGGKKKEKEKSINQSLILFKILTSLYALLVNIHFLFGFDEEIYPAMLMERRYYFKMQFKSTKKTAVTNKNQLHFSELFSINIKTVIQFHLVCFDKQLLGFLVPGTPALLKLRQLSASVGRSQK